MTWLIGGIAFLIIGYFTYGKLVERFLAPTDSPTPALAHPDGVDCMPLSKWKNMLIQLLNIAGVGPVIGVIAGIKFGKIALLIIPVGCVFLGAVHDFVGGMASIRMDGANLPKIIRSTLGRWYSTAFSWFMLALLLLVVAVFINVPANLIDKQWLPDVSFFWWAVSGIFVYYIAATLFPVDAIIGRIYPVFGGLLLIGSLAMLCALLWCGFGDASLLDEGAEFLRYRAEVFDKGGRSPVFPLLFVTIACGIISGFHATQSPIVARTIKSEREARVTFYGMMIAEGVIAMIWASAALAMYNIAPENLHLPPAQVLGKIASHFLGPWMGGVAVLAIVVLAVTSGDTALRSSRLSLAEMLGIDQVKIVPRIMTCLPLIAIVAVCLWWSNLSARSFGHVWNYFAWGNQVLSASTLMACSVWMLREGKGMKSLVALVPGMFMTAVVVTFILWTSIDKGQPWGLVPGGMPLVPAIAVSVAVAIAFAAFALRRGHCAAKQRP
jgi:carbon starvation protein CstA